MLIPADAKSPLAPPFSKGGWGGIWTPVLLILGFPLSPYAADVPKDAVSASSSSLPAQAITEEPVQLVQPELDPSLLENLPAPAVLPPGVRPLRVVIGRGEWRGSQCGITRPAQLVFRKPEIWKKFWTLAMKPYAAALNKIPSVDFSKDMVVGVFMGGRMDPHYEIRIAATQFEDQDSQRALIVRYREIHKMSGVFNPPFPVQPFHLKRLPAFPGPVLFVRGKR